MYGAAAVQRQRLLRPESLVRRPALMPPHLVNNPGYRGLVGDLGWPQGHPLRLKMADVIKRLLEEQSGYVARVGPTWGGVRQLPTHILVSSKDQL